MIRSEIDVVVTGTAWLGGGFGAVDTARETLFARVTGEVLLTAYSISPGDSRIVDLLAKTLSRGVQVKAVVNRLQEQPPDCVAALVALARTYQHFRLFDYCHDDRDADLHAKLMVFDRDTAIVGSSNLSKRGLVTNQELGLVIRGPAAQRVAEAVDRLLGDRCCQLLPVRSPS